MRERTFLILLFSATLAIRVAYLLEIRDNPFFAHPILDEQVHHEWASRLARGEEWFPNEPYFRAPLYPYVLSLFMRIGGTGFLAPRLLQAILVSLNPVLLYLLGRALAPRTVAAVAAVGIACYGMLLHFDGGFYLESLLVPLVLASLLLLARASAPGSDRRLWAGAGIALGLAAVTRPNILLFATFLPFWMRSVHGGWRRAGHALLLLGAGAALPIAPVFLHNVSAGDPVLVSWQGGINFYIGNNPESDGMTAIAPGTEGTWWGGYRDMIAAAEGGAAGKLRRSEVSDYWTRRALRFLREEPAAAAALLVKKAYLLVNDFEVSNNQGIYYFRRYSTIFSALGRFGFGVLLPLAAAGAVFMRWNRRLLLLPLFLGSYGLSVVLFFVADRYRMPLVPVLMLPAALALVRTGEALRGRRSGRLAGAGALFVACAILASSNLYRLDRNQEAQGRFNAGVARMEAGEFREAEEEFGRALRERPDYASARYNSGLCRSYLGDLALARSEFEALLRDHPDHAEGRRALASVAAREGDRDEALRQLDEAIRLNPSFVDALQARADLLEEAGRSEEAKHDRERAREIFERTASLIQR